MNPIPKLLNQVIEKGNNRLMPDIKYYPLYERQLRREMVYLLSTINDWYDQTHFGHETDMFQRNMDLLKIKEEPYFVMVHRCILEKIQKAFPDTYTICKKDFVEKYDERSWELLIQIDHKFSVAESIINKKELEKLKDENKENRLEVQSSGEEWA